MGGKNSFLGIAYVVVGGLCIVLGAFFTLAHLFKPRYVDNCPVPANAAASLTRASTRKLGDHTYLSWNNNDAHSTAVATGRDSRPGTQHA